MIDFSFICTTARLTAPRLSVFNKKKTFVNKTSVRYYYLILLHLSKPTTKCNCGTAKLDRDFSSAIALVLLTFKLIYHIHRLLDAQKEMRPMA